MIVVKLAVIAIAGMVVLNVLKSNESGLKIILQLSIVAAIMIYITPQMKELLSVAESFSPSGEFELESIRLVIKVFVILTVGSLCADICRDNGETAVANTLELGSRIVAVTCALPVFTAVISVATAFLQG